MTHFIGLTTDHIQKNTTALRDILSDTILLAVKTRGFHWNVKGLHFLSLHELFDEQFNDLNEAADTLAERIKALNEHAPGSFSDFQKHSIIVESAGDVTEADMLNSLIKDNEAVIERIRGHISAMEASNDFETVDILTDRLIHHGKAAWKLRSHIA